MITKLDGNEKLSAREMLLSLVTLQPQGEALFSDRLPLRRLGYPFFQHDLTRDQWGRLAAAATRLDEQPASCLMASIGPVRAFDAVFRVDLNGDYPYPEMITLGWPSVYDSLVCDERGKWAIIVNSEDCATIGTTTNEAINALAAALVEFSDSGFVDLCNHWKEELSNATDRDKAHRWIERHLRHAYSNAAGALIASLDG
jgi:hypothetical protein